MRSCLARSRRRSSGATRALLVVAAVFLLTSPAWAHQGVINVGEAPYNAPGDGSDQTAALQAAIDDAAALATVISNGSHGGGTPAGSCPVVYLPPGVYRINDSLVLKSKFQVIRGDNAILRPTSGYPANAPAIEYGTPMRVRIEGLLFLDFKYAIKLGGTGYDQNQSLDEITRCQFVGITGTAIRYGNRSSVLNVESCRFDNCAHAMKVWNCDLVRFRGCWVSQKGFTSAHDSTIFIEGGTFHARDSFFIPAGTTSAAECAWFRVEPVQSNSHYILRIENCRLSKENGGLTLVNWCVEGDQSFPASPSGLVIRDSITEGGQNNTSGQEQCLVRLFEVPNFIVIKNNAGLVNATTMQWAAGVNGASKVWTDSVNKPLTVDVSGNCGGGMSQSGYAVDFVLPEFSGKANQR